MIYSCLAALSSGVSSGSIKTIGLLGFSQFLRFAATIKKFN